MEARPGIARYLRYRGITDLQLLRGGEEVGHGTAENAGVVGGYRGAES